MVNAFKRKDAQNEKLSKNPKTVRQRLVDYISDTLRCRQEEEPLIGAYIDLAKYEPLHGKNNVVKVKRFSCREAEENRKGFHWARGLSLRKYYDPPL